MKPLEQQAQYRGRCQYKRKGRVVTEIETGKPVDKFESINAAKRWVREHAPFRTYRV